MWSSFFQIIGNFIWYKNKWKKRLILNLLKCRLMFWHIILKTLNKNVWKRKYLLYWNIECINGVTQYRFIVHEPFTSKNKHKPDEPSKNASDYTRLGDPVSRFNWSTVCPFKKVLVDFATLKKLALPKPVS